MPQWFAQPASRTIHVLPHPRAAVTTSGRFRMMFLAGCLADTMYVKIRQCVTDGRTWQSHTLDGPPANRQCRVANQSYRPPCAQSVNPLLARILSCAVMEYHVVCGVYRSR